MEACTEAEAEGGLHVRRCCAYVDGEVAPRAKDAESLLQDVSGGALRELMKYQTQRNHVSAAVVQVGVLRSPMLEGQGFDPPLLHLRSDRKAFYTFSPQPNGTSRAQPAIGSNRP